MTLQYLIIAGPQAAGKTTLSQHICSQSARFIPLEEARQVIVHKYQRKGAIFMTDIDELEVIQLDMTRMVSILGESCSRATYIDETNVFTVGHARAHGIDLLDGYLEQYCNMLTRLKTGIVFLNVAPEVSLNRRRHRYLQRLWDLDIQERDEIMVRYRGYLDRLYTDLLAIYDYLDFPKIKLDGSRSAEETSQAAIEAFRQLEEQM